MCVYGGGYRKLESSGKRRPQLRKCVHLIAQDIFLVNDVEGLTHWGQCHPGQMVLGGRRKWVEQASRHQSCLPLVMVCDGDSHTQ